MPAAFAVVLGLALIAPTAALADDPVGPPDTGGVLPPPPPDPPPSITGSAVEASTLTAADGDWGPVPTSRQWVRCDLNGDNCFTIAGQTGPTLLLTPALLGQRIKLRVTGTGLLSFREADSALTARVLARPPAATTAPSFTGTARDGEILSGNLGVWTGTPTIGFARAWQRCAPPTFTTCTNIPGATAASYTLTPADVGHQVRLAVTGTGPTPPSPNQTTAFSAKSATVEAIAVQGTVAPSFTGTARDGQLLTGSSGSFSGSTPIATAHQWQRCAPPGFTTCTNIPGATNPGYTLTAADIGTQVRLTVTATGPTPPSPNSVTVSSAKSATVEAIAVNVLGPPTITGVAAAGQTLTGGPAVFGGSGPLVRSFQWQRCAAPTFASCSNIGGATASTYTLTSADAGSRIRLREVATGPTPPSPNQATADSAQTDVVAAAPIQNTAPPSVSGTPRDGQLLTASPGTHTGTNPGPPSYQWQRCNSAGASCSPIGGATGASYTATADDVGGRLRVVVSVSGPEPPAGNTATTASAATAVVEGIPAQNSVAPQLSDTTPTAGAQLSGTNGTWTGTAPISFAYRWQRCAAPAFTTCTDIAGVDAADADYTPTGADTGSKLRLRVTATGKQPSNPVSNSAVSAQSDAVAGDPPVATGPTPVPTGTTTDGATLSVPGGAAGRWGGPGSPFSFAYAWLRCDAGGGSCQPIAGATGVSYTLASADIGTTIRLRETATGSLGQASQDSPATAVIAAVAPTNRDRPGLVGSPVIGAVLFASEGFWNGSAPQTYSIEWFRCTNGGCSATGATGPFYSAKAVDAGFRLKARVTATNSAGSASAETVQSAIVTAPATPKPPVTTPPSAKPKKKLRKLRPFPRVAIGGQVQRSLTLIRGFRIINAPRGSRVSIRCRGGRGKCAYRKLKTRKVGRKRRLRVKSAEYFYGPGAVVEVRITKRGLIGKYVRFRFRANRAPKRREACLRPGRTKPSRCP